MDETFDKMKTRILCLSDLHINVQPEALESGIVHPFARQVAELAEEVNPDVVVLTGDTIVPNTLEHLNSLLRQMFPGDYPVVLTLGNHEFWGRTFDETLDVVGKLATFGDERFHYLDHESNFVFRNLNFVGGTLFFDGSMRISESQKITPWDGWNDWMIKGIEKRYRDFNRFYMERIRQYWNRERINVLCTHHLPHERLNGHAPSHYSFYSGMKDFLSELPHDENTPQYAICGHTHRRVIGEILPGFMGVNVGNDYGKLQHYILEI